MACSYLSLPSRFRDLHGREAETVGARGGGVFKETFSRQTRTDAHMNSEILTCARPVQGKARQNSAWRSIWSPSSLSSWWNVLASGRGSQFSLMVGPLIYQPPPEQAPHLRPVGQHNLNSVDLKERNWEGGREEEGRERKKTWSWVSR